MQVHNDMKKKSGARNFEIFIFWDFLGFLKPKNMVYVVNKPKFHGFWPIKTQKMKISKFRAPDFFFMSW